MYHRGITKKARAEAAKNKKPFQGFDKMSDYELKQCQDSVIDLYVFLKKEKAALEAKGVKI